MTSQKTTKKPSSAKHGDKPLGNIKRVTVGDEESLEPAEYPLKTGKLVTFPNPLDMDIEEYELFAAEVQHAQQTGISTPVLRRWLSEDDYSAFIAECSTPRQIGKVLDAVNSYYKDVFGTLGE